MRARTVLAALGLALSAFGGSACGGSAGAPASADSPRTPAESAGGATLEETAEPRTVEEARAQIARAEASLEGSPLKRSEIKTESTADQKPATGGPAGRQEGRALADTSSCRTPCQALRSMRRAVTALCRMTGEGDERCTDARRTLATSEQRAAACGCSP